MAMFSFISRCYWGYCFESLATEDPRRAVGERIHHVDANTEYCAVIKTKLGAHRILMGAEMDCCDSTDEGRRFYVELKTSRELERRTEERYEREKLLKFWIQSFLAGMPYIVIGFREESAWHLLMKCYAGFMERSKKESKIAPRSS